MEVEMSDLEHHDLQRGVRSFFSFGVGLGLMAIGLSTMVAELSPLSLPQAASLAVMVAGGVLFAALVAAPRSRSELR